MGHGLAVRDHLRVPGLAQIPSCQTAGTAITCSIAWTSRQTTVAWFNGCSSPCPAGSTRTG